MKKIQRNGGSIYEVHEWIRIIYEFCDDLHKKVTVSTAVSPLSHFRGSLRCPDRWLLLRLRPCNFPVRALFSARR